MRTEQKLRFLKLKQQEYKLYARFQSRRSIVQDKWNIYCRKQQENTKEVMAPLYSVLALIRNGSPKDKGLILKMVKLLKKKLESTDLTQEISMQAPKPLKYCCYRERYLVNEQRIFSLKEKLMFDSFRVLVLKNMLLYRILINSFKQGKQSHSTTTPLIGHLFGSKQHFIRFKTILYQVKQNYPNLGEFSSEFSFKLREAGVSLEMIKEKMNFVLRIELDKKNQVADFESILKAFMSFSFSLKKKLESLSKQDKAQILKSQDQKRFKKRYEETKDRLSLLKVKFKETRIQEKILLEKKALAAAALKARFDKNELKKRAIAQKKIVAFRKARKTARSLHELRVSRAKQQAALALKESIQLNHKNVKKRNDAVLVKMEEKKKALEWKKQMSREMEKSLEKMKENLPYAHKIKCIEPNFKRLQKSTFSSAAVISLPSITYRRELKDNTVYKELLLRLKELNLHNSDHAKVLLQQLSSEQLSKRNLVSNLGKI